jgi:hypothetical protein
MLIGQPSEEMIDGARAMLADQLYARFGKPDLAVGLHDTNTHAAGTVALVSGPAMAGSTSIDVASGCGISTSDLQRSETHRTGEVGVGRRSRNRERS